MLTADMRTDFLVYLFIDSGMWTIGLGRNVYMN